MGPLAAGNGLFKKNQNGEHGGRKMVNREAANQVLTRSPVLPWMAHDPEGSAQLTQNAGAGRGYV